MTGAKASGPGSGSRTRGDAPSDLSGSGVEEIAQALLGVGIGIPEATAEHARLAVGLYGELAKGAPIPPQDFDRITGASGIPGDFARAAAARWLEFDPSGSLTGFGGLTLQPTRHRLVLDGRPFYLWCALDGFLVAHALGRSVCIESCCPATGAQIRVTASEGCVDSVEPTASVMSVMVPESGDACNVTETRRGFCDFVNFYQAETVARASTSGRGAAILRMDQAFTLAGLLTIPLRRART